MGKVDQKVKTSSYKIKKFWSDVMSRIWRRKWQSTPIFLPEEFHGWRSLAGYRACKESEFTELLTHTMYSMVTIVNNVCVCVFSCVWLCNSTDCGLPDFPVHGVFLAKILESVVISYSRGIFPTQAPNLFSSVSCTGRRILYHCVTQEAHSQEYCNAYLKIAKTVDLESTHHEKKVTVWWWMLCKYIYTHTYISLYK